MTNASCSTVAKKNKSQKKISNEKLKIKHHKSHDRCITISTCPYSACGLENFYSVKLTQCQADDCVVLPSTDGYEFGEGAKTDIKHAQHYFKIFLNSVSSDF